MAKTREMSVSNIAFLLDRLAADTPVNQQIRELTQNAIEAIQRRWQNGDSSEGIIRWDVDWPHASKTKHYKLCIIDNGDGMTGDQMKDFLNSLAVQGANQTQGITANFGIGAKITALYRNRYGLVYQSWRDEQGTMVKLHRDDDEGVYGLASFDLPDGPHFTPRVGATAKPSIISKNGTKVSLWGNSEEENTCLKPAQSMFGETNWLYKYLNTRYFRLPDNLTMQVRMLRKDPADWPKTEPPAGHKTFSFETIRGMGLLLDDSASAKGTIRLSNANAHWWLFNEREQANHKLNPRALSPGHVGLVFQNELYIFRIGASARRIFAAFGIIFGSENVVIYIEPRTGGENIVHADTARSRILINNEDVEESNWWEIWGGEFKEKMPPQMSDMINAILAKTERDPEGKTRERILERLKKIRELLRPSRYRKDPGGNLLATGEVTGGGNGAGDTDGEGSGSGNVQPSASRRRGSAGRASDEYLAELIAEGGQPVTEVRTEPREPDVRWVSVEDKTREPEEMVDRAAEIVGDVMTGEMIKANRDFRGYRDLIKYFAREFNPSNDEAISVKIIEHVEEWLTQQLIEAVVTVRNLENGRTWDKSMLEQALSPEALTSVMMPRAQIVEKVRRALSNEMARPKVSVG